MSQITISEDYNVLIGRTYEENFQGLCAIVFNIIPDYNVAKDIVQEVFTKIWDKQIDFSTVSNVKSYLRRAVKNKTLNYLRNKKEVSTSDFRGFNLPHPNLNRLENQELTYQISKIISALPERCQVIFMMSRFENKKYSEIADELNISIKTVEGQISKALKTLRDGLISN